MSCKKEKFLVTCALPYANGGLHVGHLAGAYLPGDVYVRYRRLQGHDVHFACGSDEHGAAITILALRENTTPRAIVDKYHEVLKNDLEKCGIEFDIFSRTTHPCHIKRSQEFFLNLRQNGFIEEKSEKRLYCGKCQRFLPDRYVVGECPSCHSQGARGDQCEKCGTWYEPEALINPVCQICRVTSAGLKDTSHWYISLDKLESKLRPWLESKTGWRRNVLGYAFQPLKAELAPRSITRDLDWGVPVPLPEAAGKVLYVWFDAPIGYISASEDWAQRSGQPDKWKEYWEDPGTHLVHFIGKDNIIFHTVVWPAILMGDGRYILPDLVAGNEFLNLEGEKISTSRNYAIWTSDAVSAVGRDLLRFYVTRISPENSDANFTWQDFQSRINGELADVLGNLVNRTLSFLVKNYAGCLVPEKITVAQRVQTGIEESLAAYCQHLDNAFSKLALEAIIDLGRLLNVFFQEAEPWKVRKTDALKAHQSLHSVCLGIKAIALMLYPICPGIAQKIWEQLGFRGQLQKEAVLDDCLRPFDPAQKLGDRIEPVVQKVEDSLVAREREKLGLLLAR